MAKKIDVCCHCGKDVGGYYVNPDGYYYLSESFIGCSSHERNNDCRLCVDCFKIFKEVVGGFFKMEEEVIKEFRSCENCKHWTAKEKKPCRMCYELDEWDKNN